MPNYQLWDYAEMRTCANQLDDLYERSEKNKHIIYKAFRKLISEIQDESNATFLAVYSERIPGIERLCQLLAEEVGLLRSYVNLAEIEKPEEVVAAEIRRRFGV